MSSSSTHTGILAGFISVPVLCMQFQVVLWTMSSYVQLHCHPSKSCYNWNVTPSLTIFQPSLPGGSLSLSHLINTMHPEEIRSFPSKEKQAGSFEHLPCARILKAEKLLPANTASLIESGWEPATLPEKHHQMAIHNLELPSGSIIRLEQQVPQAMGIETTGGDIGWKILLSSSALFCMYSPQPFFFKFIY